MANPKATFSLDDETLRRLAATADRVGKSKSEVVREAVAEYAARVDRLSEGERLRLLRAFDELVPRIPERPVGEVDRELAALRAARRGGGRRVPS
jgi:predicted DNA-binding protein